MQQHARDTRVAENDYVQQTVIDASVGRDCIGSAHVWAVRDTHHRSSGFQTATLVFNSESRTANLAQEAQPSADDRERMCTLLEAFKVAEKASVQPDSGGLQE